MFKSYFSVIPRFGVIVLLAGLLMACQPVADLPTGGHTEPATLVVATHSSFAVSEAVIASFEAEHNATVQFLDLGDAGEAPTKDHPEQGRPPG